ncbi:MAG: pilus assembly FimT family protein, partial [Myxococcota bacterium]
MAAPAQAGPASRAFTLIELLAVLLIMALVAGLTLPNLSLRADRAVLGAAQDLAATFAFTRQRAAATAVPHRVVIDLDQAAYWIELQPEAPDAFAATASAAPVDGGARPIQLGAPLADALEFQPLPG